MHDTTGICPVSHTKSSNMASRPRTMKPANRSINERGKIINRQLSSMRKGKVVGNDSFEAGKGSQVCLTSTLRYK